MTVQVFIDGLEIKTKRIIFSGGEVQAKVLKGSCNNLKPYPKEIYIKVKLQSSDDIMELLQVNDSVKRIYPLADRFLFMPYAPYARQDRVCSEGESLASKVFADLINICGFKKVLVVDCHSDVLPALIDNCESVHVKTVIASSDLDGVLKGSEGFIVSPDAGANKKVFDVAKEYPLQTFVRADKVRDPNTGAISGTEVYCEDFKGKPVTIVDDLVDGGYTFVKLAEKLKERNSGKITLYATHGIFSKGLEVFNNLIDEVWTTDSFDSNITHEKLNIITL